MTNLHHTGAQSDEYDFINAPRLSRAPLAWAILVLWGALAFVFGIKGVFAGPSPLPIAIITAVSAPSLLFLLVYKFSLTLRTYIDALDIGEVLALQGWRVIGFAFLAIWSIGQLPAVFAWPAGAGDVAVGLMAPAIAINAARKTAHWRRGVYALTAAGVADFIVAFATGLLAGEGRPLHFDGAPASTLLETPPLSMFPTFIVPAFIILHIIALIKLREGK